MTNLFQPIFLRRFGWDDPEIFAPGLSDAAKIADLSTPLRVAHFMAQMATENGFTALYGSLQIIENAYQRRRLDRLEVAQRPFTL